MSEGGAGIVVSEGAEGIHMIEMRYILFCVWVVHILSVRLVMVLL